VIFVPRARRRGLAVVLSVREGRPAILTQERKFFRAAPRDFTHPPEPLARIRLPQRGSARSARFRRDVAAQLVALNVKAPKRRRGGPSREAVGRAQELEARAAEHPVAACPDLAEHERWAERASKVERRVKGLDRRIRSRTDSLARQFDRVLKVLAALGYVEEFSLTLRGERLTRIYGEGDILVAEALADEAFDGLTPPEMAAVVSTVVYESRERQPRAPVFPTVEVEVRFGTLRDVYARVRGAEERGGVELTRELDAGFAAAAFHWAEGKSLEDALRETQMAPGDFVRTCKQLIDLLRQIEDVADEPAARLAAEARRAVNRGVVAYTGL
jgi:ATP-dependent RNA helicase HelY